MLQPGLRALLPTIGFIFAGQTLAAVPAVVYKTEKVRRVLGAAERGGQLGPTCMRGRADRRAVLCTGCVQRRW